MGNKGLRTLTKRLEFASLKANGQRVRPAPWLLLSFQKNSLSHSRFGWTISAKVGNAVTRNRLKRWCRDFFRDHQGASLVPIDVNVVILAQSSRQIQSLSHGEFLATLEPAWQKVAKWTAKNASLAR